jgi:hypothetical protein
MGWTEHIARMGAVSNAYKILDGNLEETEFIVVVDAVEWVH